MQYLRYLQDNTTGNDNNSGSESPERKYKPIVLKRKNLNSIKFFRDQRHTQTTILHVMQSAKDSSERFDVFSNSSLAENFNIFFKARNQTGDLPEWMDDLLNIKESLWGLNFHSFRFQSKKLASSKASLFHPQIDKLIRKVFYLSVDKICSVEALTNVAIDIYYLAKEIDEKDWAIVLHKKKRDLVEWHRGRYAGAMYMKEKTWAYTLWIMAVAIPFEYRINQKDSVPHWGLFIQNLYEELLTRHVNDVTLSAG